jgi:hypothetical protein
LPAKKVGKETAGDWKTMIADNTTSLPRRKNDKRLPFFDLGWNGSILAA